MISFGERMETGYFECCVWLFFFSSLDSVGLRLFFGLFPC